MDLLCIAKDLKEAGSLRAIIVAISLVRKTLIRLSAYFQKYSSLTTFENKIVVFHLDPFMRHGFSSGLVKKAFRLWTRILSFMETLLRMRIHRRLLFRSPQEIRAKRQLFCVANQTKILVLRKSSIAGLHCL